MPCPAAPRAAISFETPLPRSAPARYSRAGPDANRAHPSNHSYESLSQVPAPAPGPPPPRSPSTQPPALRRNPTPANDTYPGNKPAANPSPVPPDRESSAVLRTSPRSDTRRPPYSPAAPSAPEP